MTWQLKEQSRIKHKLLAEYLCRWFPILAQRRREGERILYIDGFAGPGRYPSGDLGSPLLALSVALGHRLLPALLKRPRFEIVWIFIEADKLTHGHLVEELRAYLHTNPPPTRFRVVDPIRGEFNDQMTAVLEELEEQKKRLAPAFVFVDPFGPAGFSLQTIGGIMANRSCEVLIRLNYTRLANTFLRRRDMAPRIDELYGCDRWRQANALPGEDRERYLLDLYREQLQSQAGARFVQPFKVVDATGHVAYFVFATNSSHGFEEMKEAMWKIDPQGLFRWRAKSRRQPDQGSFLPRMADEECQSQLAEKIGAEFVGRRVLVSELEDFVRQEPVVVLRHLRPTLGRLEHDRRIISVVNPDGSYRRKGTFPRRARVTFA